MATGQKSINRILLITPHHLEAIPFQREYPIIEFLKTKVERVDILHYDRAYDNEGIPAFEKLKEGLHNFSEKPILRLKADQNVTYYGIRRLPVDGTLSSWLQDPWIYNRFHSINKVKYDICISEAPGPARVARRLRENGFAKYYIYDDTDYYPGFAKGLRAQVLSQQEKIGVRSADAVICMGEKSADLRTRQGAKKVSIVPNGVNLSIYSTPPSVKPHEPRLIFSGTLENWAGVHLVIEAFPLIQKQIPNIQFQIIGDGPELQKLKDLVKQLNIQEPVQFLGRINQNELVNYFSQADIGIITPVPSKLWDYACPLKLFHYMAAGLPVIGTDIGELGLLLRKLNVGIPIKFDKSELANQVIGLIQNSSMKEKYARNGKESVKNYDWPVLMERYWNVIQGVVHANRD